MAFSDLLLQAAWQFLNIDDGTGCVEEINELVLQYNTMLEEHIVRLNEELSDAQIVSVICVPRSQEDHNLPTIFW